jgi:hypothetical protein
MIAYISFAADTAREQELLSSAPITEFAFQYAYDMVEEAEGLSYGKILAGHDYPFLSTSTNLEYALLPPRPRYRAERERIYKVMDDTQLWRIIIRPLQGRISLARLEAFCAQLACLEGDQATREMLEIEQAISVAPYLTLSNPLWNCISTDHHHFDGSSVRLTNLGSGAEKHNDVTFGDSGSEMGELTAVSSQGLQDIYYYDNALCAFRYTWDFESQENPLPPHPIYVNKEDYLDSLPTFYQIATFEMSHSTAISTHNIEKTVLHA